MKWEDNIKETLEKRTIKPSNTSWNTLADKLDATNKNKRKTMYLWMGIAANVVALLFTITIFFNGYQTEINTPAVVNTQEQVDEYLISVEKLPVEKQVAETQADDQILEPVEKNIAKNELLKKPNDFTPPVKQNIPVAKIDKEVAVEPLEINLQKESFEDKKIAEMVAQIQDLKNKGQTVTDADIEALLHQAQKEIAYHTIIKEGMKTVDANALLQDVESDLQQSFRNKIFEALKNSYETIKTAVAERNN